ncbi:MAG: AIPR family protein [Prevotella sp.]|nr:AIPR family protein [Prevotella sp.]
MAFEKFVDYSILSHDDTSSFIGDPDLLDFCWTGGEDDAKLDGVGIKINGRIVGNVDDINQIVENSRKIEVEFFVIQAKERTDFDSADFNTFGIGVQNFFSEPKLPENDRVRALRKLKDYIYTEPTVIKKLEDNPSVFVYYVFCGQKPDDDHTAGIINILEGNLRNCPDSIGTIDVSILGGKDLINCCKEIENEYVAELNVNDIYSLSVGNNDLVKKAYTFTCCAKELLRLLSKEDDTIRRSLFNDNVRDYLGNKGGVNSEIEKTIKEDPEMFLLCNNGITIVCSDFNPVRNKLVTIYNPQIVNGCQTCNSIFSLRKCNSVDKVNVLIKLICTEDINVTNKIVRGTNKQNQVLDESFETTKRFHQELEEYFIAKRDVVQLYYERRVKQYSSIPSVNKYQIVNLRVITQTLVGMFLMSPHEAHRHEAKLLEQYASDDNRIIYREGQPFAPYYLCALTWYKFEEAFREGKIDKRLKTYKAHLYMVFMFTSGSYPLPLDANNTAMEKFCTKMETILTSTDFYTVAIEIEKVFNYCVSEWIRKGNSRFAIKDNKSFTEFLKDVSRRKFVNQTFKEEDLKPNVQERWVRGIVLSVRMENNNKWFAFIKTNINQENVYFDKRAYSGELTDLIPGKKVHFIFKQKRVGQNSEEQMLYATKVKLNE